MGWKENHPGELNYAQFYESFKDLPYDLSQNDMRMLLAIADESPNGAINWKEFIPVSIDATKTFLARNKLMSKGKLFSKELDTDTMGKLFTGGVAMASKILTRKFKKADYDLETKSFSGFTSFKFMEEVFRQSCFLTTKETNLMLREYVTKHGYDKIPYTNIEKDLLDVRLQLLNNRTSGINVEKHEEGELLQRIASSHDTVKPQMTIQELRDVLYRCKQVVLTPLQINILIGLANAGPAGLVDVKSFNPLFKQAMLDMFTIEPLRRKSQILALNQFKKEHVQMPEFDDMELFKVFRDFDEDNKGFLEPSEFYKCLESFKPLALKPSAITTLVLLCDNDMNMRIDYSMIMTIFRDLLFQVSFQMQLHEKYVEEQRLAREAGEQQ